MLWCRFLLPELSLSLELALLLEVEGDIIGEESFADTQALVHEGLRRLELSQQLGPHNVLLDDGSQPLVVHILQERVASLVLGLV